MASHDAWMCESLDEDGKVNNGGMKLIVKAYVDDLLAMSKIEDEEARIKLQDLGFVHNLYFR